MCAPGQPPAPPATAAQAMAMVTTGLSWLATINATTLTAAEQAGVLRGLEQAQSRHTAARASIMTAFHTAGGHESDGHPTTRSWLQWQTQLTRGAACGAAGWMRRLTAHPAIAHALANATISESWARELCKWTDTLPPGARHDADTILLAAATAGAELADLAQLAEQIRQRTAAPDTDGTDDGFTDRYLNLSTTLGGAGVLRGELTPQAAAAVQAVLDALGKRHGPEDTRTKGQRHHDALEEAARRLIASGNLPDRAGQPTQIMLHMTLDQLRGLPGADITEAAWAGPLAGPGADCDATIIPIVTGHTDPHVLDQVTSLLLSEHNHTQDHDTTTASAAFTSHGASAPQHQPRPRDAAETARRQLTERAVRQILIKHAADLLSGPGGLAAALRNGISDRLAASVSLPLDVGATVEIIPAHLRRAVTARDRHCRFPGCNQPPAACQPHHIIPRSQGGPTSLTKMQPCYWVRYLSWMPAASRTPSSPASTCGSAMTHPAAPGRSMSSMATTSALARRTVSR
jgi:Domain of unknown function (DUF222)